MFTQEFTTPKSVVFASGVASSSRLDVAWLVFASGVASSAWLDVACSGGPCSSFFLFLDLREPNRPKWRNRFQARSYFPLYSLKDIRRSINSHDQMIRGTQRGFSPKCFENTF